MKGKPHNGARSLHIRDGGIRVVGVLHVTLHVGFVEPQTSIAGPSHLCWGGDTHDGALRHAVM